MAGKYFAIAVFAMLLVHTFAATVYELERDLNAISRTKRNKDPECQSSTPCGWAVYARFTRKTLYFMKNKCECPGKLKCIRSEDDLSVSAYVYRCKDVTTEEEQKKPWS